MVVLTLPSGTKIISEIRSLQMEKVRSPTLCTDAPSTKRCIFSSLTGAPVKLEKIQRFVDGASVQRVGDLTFSICKDRISEMILVPEGKVSTTILQLYNEDAIVAEPAGALSIAALESYAEQ